MFSPRQLISGVVQAVC